MKKSFAILVSAAMLAAGCTSGTSSAPAASAPGSAAAPALTPGVYTGTAMGFHAPVVVEVEVDETSIKSITVTESEETRFVADNAMVQLPADMVAAQSVNVDMYTGCTISSMAVKGAVKDALSQAGDTSLFEAKPEAAARTEETIDTDVVVVGGGMAGLASALSAADNGANVVLLEKLDRVGGSTVLSGGILYATGTTFTEDNDPQALADYWQMRAEGNADDAMLLMAAEKGAATFEQLQDWGMVISTRVGTCGISPALRGHYASNAEADGASTDGVDFIVPLLKKAEEKGVKILLHTAATELLQDGAAITGVKATGKSVDYTINAKSVILATGGFDQDAKMFAEKSPEMAGRFTLASAGNTGDGIKMGEAVGAATDFTGGWIGFHMTDLTTHYIEQSNLLGWSGLLNVTDKGVRYGNEFADYPIYCTQMVTAEAEGAEKFWIIVDSTVEMYAGLAENAVGKNLGFKGETLEEVAGAAGIDAAALQATVDAYNATVASGEADEYGKVNTVPVMTAPYYAVSIQPASLGTMGGLVINADAEVLDTNGNAIENLYAAGAVCNSWVLYREYPASGTSITTSATIGIIAGENAAK